MNSGKIEVFYSTPKIQGKDAFLLSEIERHIISEFARQIVDKIEKTECEHCNEYRLRLNVLTDYELEIVIHQRVLKIIREGQVI